jgi:hypothetical protein
MQRRLALTLVLAAALLVPSSAAAATSTITFRTQYNYGGVYYRLPGTLVRIYNQRGTLIRSGRSNSRALITFSLTRGARVRVIGRKVRGDCMSAEFIYSLDQWWRVPSSRLVPMTLAWQQVC